MLRHLQGQSQLRIDLRAIDAGGKKGARSRAEENI
jgi:hypothetical protein